MKFGWTVTALPGFLVMLGMASPAVGFDLIPPGLEPGDQYRIVFVTSFTTTAESGNISDYDKIVTDAAAASGSILQSLGATWQAIVSTDSESAFDHIGGTFSVPIFRVDGIEVATGSSQLWSGTLLDSILLDQTGSPAAGTVVWTGTGTDGLQDNPLGGATPLDGCTTVTTPQWIDLQVATSNSLTFPLYGISSILTVPVPEPGIGGTILIGMLVVASLKFAP